MGFGANLKGLLKERGMTLKQFSEKSGIPVNTLYAITKRDSNNVRVETVEKIADTLNITADSLITYQPQEHSEKLSEKSLKNQTYLSGCVSKVISEYDKKMKVFKNQLIQESLPNIIEATGNEKIQVSLNLSPDKIFTNEYELSLLSDPMDFVSRLLFDIGVAMNDM